MSQSKLNLGGPLQGALPDKLTHDLIQDRLNNLPDKTRPPTADEVREALGIGKDDNVIVRVEQARPGESLSEAVARVHAEEGVSVEGEGPHMEELLAGERRLASVVFEVFQEVQRAQRKHGPMNSPHEGYAVLKDEVEELWDEIKANAGDGVYAREEAIQVAAMAVRYVLDNIDNQK